MKIAILRHLSAVCRLLLPVLLGLSQGESLAAPTFGSNSATINNKYYPLKVGSKLTLRGTGRIAGNIASAQATAIETVDGVSCIKVVDTASDGTTYEWLAQDTSGAVWRLRQYDVSLDEYDEDDYLYMPANPQVGETSHIWLLDYEIASLTETVTVPAGTYSGCLHLRCMDDAWPDEHDIYAPWVGEVKEYDTLDGWQLISATGLSPAPPALVITWANPAANVPKALTIGKQNQTIALAAFAGHTVGEPDFSPGATATSGLTVTYASASPAVATIVAGKIHLVGKGTAVITASQAGNISWDVALPVKQTLTVAGKPQTITFPALANTGYGAADFAPGATDSSGLPVSYASSTPTVVTIVNGKLHAVATGTAIITATQAGDANWNAAPAFKQTLTVGPMQTTLDIPSYAGLSYTHIYRATEAGVVSTWSTGVQGPLSKGGRQVYIVQEYDDHGDPNDQTFQLADTSAGVFETGILNDYGAQTETTGYWTPVFLPFPYHDSNPLHSPCLARHRRAVRCGVRYGSCRLSGQRLCGTARNFRVA